MTWILCLALVLLAAALLYRGSGWLAFALPGGLAVAWLGFHTFGQETSWLEGVWQRSFGEEPCGPACFWWVAVPYALLALVFAPTPLRRVLITPAVLKLVAPMLPRMSETERVALEAGTVWFDRDLFSGRPDWEALLRFRLQPLSPQERAFLAGPVEELCRMSPDWEVVQRGDLSSQAWDFIRSQGFLGMIIPKEHGGLGFSALAHSAVVAKLSSRSAAAAVSVMVPNSLGPAELLLHYGTPEQQRHYLPRLARGEEMPCFALTEPGAGSDAGGIRSNGVVCRGTYAGRDVLGMRLNWDKRYITLSPIATVLGLAFVLRDPERLLGGASELGITCALIPASLPGVELGRRHDPLGVPFHNGPTTGRDVFVPLDCIIGGPAMAGKGWMMLMQSLAAGRGISLPSLSVGASELCARTVSAYASVREQFGMPIGRFEGIEEPLARIGGLTWMLEASRTLTAGAIDAGEKPSVLTAIVKRYMTEAMRQVVNDSMDVVAGAGICRGPRNVLAGAYTATPIGITVEGANILTRTLIVFGQGALRCHPYAQEEMRTAAARDLAGFDRAFFGHVAFAVGNAVRSFALGLTRGALTQAPGRGSARDVLQKLTYLSSAFALTADLAMGTLGGDLKRKGKITGRMADCLGWMYLASAAVKRFSDAGHPEEQRAFFEWGARHALHEAQRALAEALDNFPLRIAAWLARPLVLPPFSRLKAPSDRMGARVAHAMLDGAPARESLALSLYRPPADEAGLGQLEAALAAVVSARPVERKLKDALRARKLEREPAHELAQRALAAGVIDSGELKLLAAAERAREAAVAVDAFEPAAYRALRG
jgi:acyl-CoA dehydrogenase